MYLDGFSREVKIARRQIGLLGALCVVVVPSKYKVVRRDRVQFEDEDCPLVSSGKDEHC